MNRLKSALFAAAAMLCCASISAQTLEDVNAKYVEGGEKMQAKQFEAAIPLFEETIQLGNQVGEEAAETVKQAQSYLPMCYLQAAGAAANAKDFDKALDYFTKARDLGELYGDTRVYRTAGENIGKVYQAMGGTAYNNKNYAEAAEIFAKGYEAAPNNTKLGLYLADSYEKADMIDEAVETYQSIIALESRHSRYAEDAATAKTELTKAMLYRASQAAEAKNTDELNRFTDIIFEYDPQNPEAHMLKLQAANNARNFRQVVEIGPAAADSQTDDVLKSNANFLVGVAYQNLDNNAKAVEYLRKVTAGPNVNTAKTLITELN